MLQSQGPDAALDRLCAELKQTKDYQSLFYTLLMKKRHELGASPIATGNNNDLPPAAHEAFELGIRDACRTVGQLYLGDRNIPQAWGYYRMIAEPAPVAEALEKVDLEGVEDVQPFVDIAFYQGVSPRKGFDWILGKFGTCNAITTVSSGELPFPADVRQYCIGRLVRTLHADLMARLRDEVNRKQGFEPTAKTVKELVEGEGRAWLFADDYYHIDVSHLNSVIQMSSQMEPGEEMRLARDLCAYGQKLSPRFQYQTDPPFDNLYIDYEKYLDILLDENRDAGLEHYRKKAADADPETIGTYPAEVLVNLLLRIGRPKEALEISRKYLSTGETRHSCPSFVELCQQVKDYGTLAEVAKEQGNPVNFLAALLAKNA